MDLHPKQGTICNLSFSPNDTFMTTSSSENDVPVWDLKTGEMVKVLQGHTRDAKTVEFSNSGTLASGSEAGSVRLWDVDSGTCTAKFVGEEHPIYLTTRSPHNQELAVARSKNDNGRDLEH